MFRRPIENNGTFPVFVHFFLAAALANPASWTRRSPASAEARRLNPKLTVKWLQSVAPNIPALFEGLRKAGCRRNDRHAARRP